MNSRILVCLWFAAIGLGCGDDTAPLDAELDAGADATPTDASPIDAGMDSPLADAHLDTGIADAGRELLVIGGTCGELDSELTDEAPHYFSGSSLFPVGFASSDSTLLSEGAQTIFEEGTAGGSSENSEAFAFEVLHRCEGAELLLSETMIDYTDAGPMTDMVVSLDGERIGVSVTRAVTVTGRCTRADTFEEAAARLLLEDKLDDINRSSNLVTEEHSWTKQILFIYADTMTHASRLMSVWPTISAELRADTIVFVSVAEGMDEFVFFNDCD